MDDVNETYGIARCSTNKQDVQYEITELVKRGVLKILKSEGNGKGAKAVITEAKQDRQTLKTVWEH